MAKDYFLKRELEQPSPDFAKAKSPSPASGRGIIGFLLLSTCCTQQANHPALLPPTGLAGAQASMSAPPQAKPLPPISGAISEVLTKDNFSYVRIGDVWVALVSQKVELGQQVTIEQQTVLNEFHSKALNRTFKKLVFGILKK